LASSPCSSRPEALAALALSRLVPAELRLLGVFPLAKAVERERLAVIAAVRARGAHGHDATDDEHEDRSQQQ
jgi:hypothetical protein